MISRIKNIYPLTKTNFITNNKCLLKLKKNYFNFLDLSDLFFNDESTEKERIEIIDRYFLKKDVHLSTNGHNLVSKEFLKKFDKN